MGIDPDHAMTFMVHTSTRRNGDVLAELWLFYVAVLKIIDCHTECLQIGENYIILNRCWSQIRKWFTQLCKAG